MKIEEKAIEILKDPICDNCLGRSWAGLLSGYSNEERGKIVRTFVAFLLDSEEKIDVYMNNFYGFKFRNLKVTLQKPEKCKICKNFFREKLEEKANEIIKKLKGIEFDTFQLGTIPSDEMANEEEKLVDEIGGDFTEPIKTEINREIGKIIEKKTSKIFSSKNPDVTIILDLQNNRIKTEVRSLYIFGKYQKLKRGIPQTKWICPDCNGKGCIKCKGTGKLYKTSVQEEIEKNFLKAAESKKSKFHGCVAGNTRILLNECQLEIKKLENCWKNHEVITFNVDKNEIRSSQIADFLAINSKDIEVKTYEITTEETGRKVIATEDHPFFTSYGMVPLRKIKEGWKVAVYPIDLQSYHETNDKIIINKNDIIHAIQNHVPITNLSKVINELKERDLLPLSSKNKHLCVLSRIVAFLFGDGTVRLSRNRDVGLEFYGNKVDLNDIASDIKKLGFKISWKKTLPKKSIFMDYYGKQKIIESKRKQHVLLCYSKSLWVLLVALGAPVGNKVSKEILIPDWIKNIEMLNVKREFLASLLGTEIDKPRLDKRKYNKKSFNCPRFSINKTETLIGNELKFIEDLSILLKNFGVNTYKPRLVPYTTRKDGSKTIKICLDISNRFENLLNLWGKIGFKYAKEKDTLARYAYEYLLMKKHAVDFRKELYKKSLELKKSGLTPVQIYRTLNTTFVNYKDLAMWLSPKNHEFQNIKIPNDFVDFLAWKRMSTKNLKNGLVWETIRNIKEVNNEETYDLTTKDSAHTFFANGFLVSNSGREDIDARNLDWRPFVIELVKPNKRKIDLKKIQNKINKSRKVKAKNLRIVEKDLIEKIKSERLDKSYLAEVEFEKNIDKQKIKELKKLEKATIIQKTPTRVVHRRADIIRKRDVKKISWELKGKKKLEIRIKTEAGLYIKELITGDEGRTNPNVADLISNKVKKISLDVIKIHTKGS